MMQAWFWKCEMREFFKNYEVDRRDFEAPCFIIL